MNSCRRRRRRERNRAFGNLRKNDFLAIIVRFSDKNSAGLGEPFEEQRSRNKRISGKMLSKNIFRQTPIFDCPSQFLAAGIQ